MNRHTATVTVTFTLNFESFDTASDTVSDLMNSDLYSASGIYEGTSISTDIERVVVKSTHTDGVIDGETTFAEYSAGTVLR